MQPKQIIKNVLNEGWLVVALIQRETILFKNVDVSKYIDPALIVTCARKPEISGSSAAANYVQR